MVQLLHLYMTTGKIIALTICTFVNKVMFLFFNMMASFSSKEKASFNFVAAVTIAVILEPKKIKSITKMYLTSFVSHCYLNSFKAAREVP